MGRTGNQLKNRWEEKKREIHRRERESKRWRDNKIIEREREAQKEMANKRCSMVEILYFSEAIKKREKEIRIGKGRKGEWEELM